MSHLFNQSGQFRICAVLITMILSLLIGSAHSAPKYSILHTFESAQVGTSPDAVPVYDTEGNLYIETSRDAGFSQGGAVYKVDRKGYFAILHAFEATSAGSTVPAGPVVVDRGDIYGIETKIYYAQGQSVLWKMTSGGNNFQVLYSFPAEVGPVTLGKDGYLYGVTEGDGSGYGTVYRIKEDGSESSVTTLHTFTRAEPYPSPYNSFGTSLVIIDNTIYGAGDQGVFSLSTNGTEKLRYRFFTQDVGSYPSGLLYGQDGFLYGTTQRGGPNSYGAIFKYDPQTNRVKSIYAFRNGRDGEGGQSLFQSADGFLYGTTATGGTDKTGQPGTGVAFRVGTDGKNLGILYTFVASDFEGLGGAQIGSTPDGQIIGYNNSGGTSSYGQIFKLFKSKTEKYHFEDFIDFRNGYAFDLELGANPSLGKLVFGKDNLLYGTTPSSVISSSGDGLVYGVSRDGSDYHGLAPGAGFGTTFRGLTALPNSKYLVSAYSGGLNQKGAVYEVGSDGTYSDVFDFNGANGSTPDSELTLANDGNYYGTTTAGGDYGQGTIYRLTYPSFTESVLYSFKGKDDGVLPSGATVLGSDGALYGVCYQSANNQNGTIWKITLDGQFSKIHDFTGSDGSGATAGLIEGFDGKLYGTTEFGGSNGAGVVYSLAKDGSNYRRLHDFTKGSDGNWPLCSLTQASNGLLYGTSLGLFVPGTLYSIRPDGSDFKVLHTFEGLSNTTDSTDGAGPIGGVIEGPDGDLYGTTSSGGQAPLIDAAGTVYKLATKLPIINCFTPASGRAGTTVTLSGANLANANSISFGGVPGVIVSHTPTQIVATVPANAVTGRIVVTVGKTPCISFTPFTIL